MTLEDNLQHNSKSGLGPLFYVLKLRFETLEKTIMIGVLERKKPAIAGFFVIAIGFEEELFNVYFTGIW